MNGVVLLVGGLLLAAVIKLIVDRNWMGLLLCVVAQIGRASCRERVLR